MPGLRNRYEICPLNTVEWYKIKEATRDTKKSKNRCYCQKHKNKQTKNKVKFPAQEGGIIKREFEGN